MDDIRSRYYLRFPIVDAPGAIGTLTTVLGKHGVSIAAVHAKVVDAAAGKGQIEILTHEALEKSVKASTAEIAKSGILRQKERLIRVEE